MDPTATTSSFPGVVEPGPPGLWSGAPGALSVNTDSADTGGRAASGTPRCGMAGGRALLREVVARGGGLVGVGCLLQDGEAQRGPAARAEGSRSMCRRQTGRSTQGRLSLLGSSSDSFGEGELQSDFPFAVPQ